MSNDIVAIDHIRMVVIDDQGFVFPITNCLDCDGDETGDWTEVVSIVAGPDSAGKWWGLDVEIDQRKQH